MSLQLANGKTFTVTAENNSAETVYIQSATLNGQPLTIPVIRWEDIMAGGSLKVVMGPSPSRWAADWKPVPLSESLTQ
jgi:putative alpha-1,2-mannosidase